MPRRYQYCESRDHTLRILHFLSETSTCPTNALKLSKCRTRFIHAHTHHPPQPAVFLPFLLAISILLSKVVISVAVPALHLSFFLTSCISQFPSPETHWDMLKLYNFRKSQALITDWMQGLKGGLKVRNDSE